MSEKQILVISFSNIAKDARVLRELSAIQPFGHVTSIGYGSKPAFVDEHLQIADQYPSLPQTPLGVLKLALHMHKAAELAAPGDKEGIRLLGNRTFDAVVANDARALPLAFHVARGKPIWADMHEWAPAERTHVTSWRLLVAPLMTHICKKYLPKCQAVSTVGQEIVKLYDKNFGVRPTLIRNAAPFADLTPSHNPTDGPIRLVHSGGAVAGRNIENMIAAVKAAGERFTLDLYLVPGNDRGKYLSQLKEQAKDCPRIKFNSPVKPAALPTALNQYDVGIYWIPPYSINAELALPNKIFDFIQARLAIAVGPTKEMANIVEEFQVGVVSSGFSNENIVETLRSLDRDQIIGFKQNTNTAAQKLCFENEAKNIEKIMKSLL
ncbi:MAG: hypothetical protein E6049_00400 [Varibaculum cambriense]|nr:hypothetical protein [Varibaculum cambriense]